MIRLGDIRLAIGHTEAEFVAKLASTLGVAAGDFLEFRVHKAKTLHGQ